ncbi:hypothetical protein PPTG_10852 [Phytophthora nicotianae INRA-310]|uniref:Uncharacterized protein n=1 Tax=Phytophthora nicotianae (strain INRA-310) TaxID=761204 RepID=W2QB98_PHYN3|nr:hypothetical protein PPTG_10852 [Phytophthora nicotianae INRA-310]ETN10141.1 hypothetical protein PPTG_10852 [Phytophthora nicotianae INRA-310]
MPQDEVGLEIIAKQGEKKKEMSRQSSKMQYIKKQLDKFGWWGEEEEKADEDNSMGVSLARNAVRVTGPDKLNQAKALATID